MAADRVELERRFGYPSTLDRQLGLFANFGLSFTVISVLTGTVTLYGHGLQWGGPLAMTIGWPLVTIMTLLVAASLAQLVSLFPTAGSLYHTTSLLAGRTAAFYCAWLNVIGQFAITAGIDFSLAELVRQMLFPSLPDAWTEAATLAVFAAILGSHLALNRLGTRSLAPLLTFSAVYQIVAVAAICALLFHALEGRTGATLFSAFTTHGESYNRTFVLALLQAQWTYTGYDASAHTSEETHNPGRNAPNALFLSVAVSGLVGYALLIAITLSIRDLPKAAGSEATFVYVLAAALDSELTVAVLSLIVMGAMWFCGFGSLMASSRIMYALARDNGLPGSQWLRQVRSSTKSPSRALLFAAAGAALVVGIDVVVAHAGRPLTTMISLSTMALYASYGLPIFAGLRRRWQGKWPAGVAWDLGRLSTIVNVLALLWITFIVVVILIVYLQLDSLRPFFLLTSCVILPFLYWQLWMKKRFCGPPVTLEELRASSPLRATR